MTVYAHQRPLLAKLVGFRRWSGRTGYFRWGELARRRSFGLAVCKFEEHWSLLIAPGPCKLFVTLPFPVHREPASMRNKWGFSLLIEERALILNWGARSKVLRWWPR